MIMIQASINTSNSGAGGVGDAGGFGSSGSLGSGRRPHGMHRGSNFNSQTGRLNNTQINIQDSPWSSRKPSSNDVQFRERSNSFSNRNGCGQQNGQQSGWRSTQFAGTSSMFNGWQSVGLPGNANIAVDALVQGIVNYATQMASAQTNSAYAVSGLSRIDSSSLIVDNSRQI